MKKSLGLVLLTISLLVTGCGKGENRKVIKNLKVETRDNDQLDKMAHVEFELDIGSAELPMASYELPNDLGELSLSLVDGKNLAAVDVNLTQALKLPAGQATLPNGSTIPVYSSGGVIQIDVEAINASIYIAQTDEVTLVGFALAISQLDGLGSELGGVGLFPQFSIGDVKMVAGLFTDDTEGGTGVTAFANLKGLFEREREMATTERMFFKRYKYSRRLLKKAKRLINDFEATPQVLTPVLR